MKARLILLSLATVLLLSCNASDDEIMNYQFKNEAMKTETKKRYQSYCRGYPKERRPI